MSLTAYADPEPTLAMIVMSTCSLIVKGPGLSDTPKILTRGTMRAQARRRGKETSCATIYRRAQYNAKDKIEMRALVVKDDRDLRQ